MNFIEKLDWIYNQSEDLSEVTEKLGAKNNWNDEQYSKFESFLWFCIETNQKIKNITYEKYCKLYHNLNEKDWDYIINCIMNY